MSTPNIMPSAQDQAGAAQKIHEHKKRREQAALQAYNELKPLYGDSPVPAEDIETRTDEILSEVNPEANGGVHVMSVNDNGRQIKQPRTIKPRRAKFHGMQAVQQEPEYEEVPQAGIGAYIAHLEQVVASEGYTTVSVSGDAQNGLVQITVSI